MDIAPELSASAADPTPRRHIFTRSVSQAILHWHSCDMLLAEVCLRMNVFVTVGYATFTACPTPAEPHQVDLEHIANAKARKAATYLTVPWGKCHEDAVMVPLVQDAAPHWMPATTL